jgi:hypothetical protein
MARRAALWALLDGALVLALAASGARSVAQRPARPINRPPRPVGPIGPGRWPRRADGVIAGQPPGVFIVRAVNARENTMLLADADGRTANVVVASDVFDVSELKPGDEVAVDFFVPNDSDTPLEAAGVWKM